MCGFKTSTTETRRHGEQQKIEGKTFATRRNGVSGGKNNNQPEPAAPLFSDASSFKGIGNAAEVTREPRSNGDEVAEERIINNPLLTPFLRVSKVLVRAVYALIRTSQDAQPKQTATRPD